MRIERISVTRFGPLHDLDTRFELPPAGGVVVVEGPNEAGKSTLLRFVYSLLFGGEPAEGALVVQHDGSRYRIDQRGHRNTLVVTDLASGERQDPSRLQRLLGNLDGKVYRNIFAFGLNELQEIRALTGEGVQERIFSAAVAGAGKSVRAVQRGLKDELERLLRPRTSCVIRDAARELRDVLGLVREAERSVSEYERLLDEEERLAADIRGLSEDLEGLGHELRRHEALIELIDPWHGRLAAKEALAAAPEVQGLPADALQRLGALRAQTELLEKRAGELTDKIAGLARKSSAPVPAEHLLAIEGLITELSAGIAIQRQRLEEDLPQIADSLKDAEHLLDTGLAGLGAAWTEGRLSSFSFSGVPAGEMDVFAQEFSTLGEMRLKADSECRARCGAAGEAGERADALRSSGANQEWLQAAAEIRSLHEASGTHRIRAERLGRVAEEVERTETELETVLRRLGPSWEEERIESFASYAEWRRRAEEARSSAGEVAEQRRRRHAAFDAAETQAAMLQQKLGALAKPGRAAVDLEAELQSVNHRAAGLERLIGTVQEYHSSRQERQTAELSLNNAQASMPPPRRWFGVVAGVVIPLAVAIWLDRLSPVAALAMLALSLVLAFLYWPRRAAGDAGEATAVLDRARASYAAAQGRVEALARCLDERGEPLGLGEVDLGTVNEALRRAKDQAEALKRELDGCRRWEEVDQDLQQATEGLQAAREQLDAARQSEADALKLWWQWCGANGIPAHIRPEDTPAFLTDLELAAGLVRRKRDAQGERDSLGKAVQGWHAGVRRLAERFAVGEAILPEAAIDVMHTEVQRAEELQDALRALDEAERRHLEASERLDRALEALIELQQRWDAWSAEHGLAATASPEEARTWLGDARMTRNHLDQARALRAKAEGLQHRVRAWEATASDLLAGAGRPVSEKGTELVRAIERLHADCQLAGALAADRDGAKALLEEAQGELRAVRGDVAEKHASAGRLLDECGAKTEEELRERLSWQERRNEWRRTIREAEEELRRRTGRDAEAFAALLDEDDPLRWEEERDSLRARMQALDARLNDPESGFRTKLGGVRAKREALEASADVATRRLRAEQRKTLLRQALRRWMVYKLADGLIGETLKEYECSHVPEVLRSASDRFAAVTGGRYRGVHALEGGRFRVYTEGDDILDAALLSRGTQEQLYLVVRLGLVDSFSKQSASLPLVLDDVLVNADPERREGLIRILVEAARDHQTILLTCHPQTAQAIVSRVRGAQHLRLDRIGPSTAARETAAALPDADAEAPDLRQLMLACLREHPEGLNGSQLCRLLEIGPGDLKGLIAPLLESGVLLREGRTKSTRYRLAEQRSA